MRVLFRRNGLIECELAKRHTGAEAAVAATIKKWSESHYVFYGILDACVS